MSSLLMSSDMKRGSHAGLKYSCEVCGCSFARLKSLKEHEQGKQHEMNLKAVPLIISSCAASFKIAEGVLTKEEIKRCIASSYRGDETLPNDGVELITESQIVAAWNWLDLKTFPSIDAASPVTYADLSHVSKARFFKYLSELIPQIFGIPETFALINSRPFEKQKVFDVFVCGELFKLIEDLVVAIGRVQSCRKIIILSCLEGLLPFLLKCRFPKIEIVIQGNSLEQSTGSWISTFCEVIDAANVVAGKTSLTLRLWSFVDGVRTTKS
ncbi:hypothetical protein GUITHDRAFT_99965 [Guillardia theta CCMP2712]|uniref:C2H2-type domain-containing protein n=1 Tax=Guillardia theta (strain CCMP2712) TaxID=905079 RepID=L1K283_GUITC|nr:hypothetical protein GUITHDRAFT_99965 [Guillardia theta CCMP2712]EKX54483.1 hypothetical protein GUITHDRAFT_99965 [Guillardia theta CCMP2712]|eukprot:XP_005841463.1 hypothetical protein GUITHDRAFT_99965 [Guillardia theta CCMP2712]